MAQHLNTNQLHPAMVNQLPMLQAAGLNLTIMSTGQQHGLPQFAQGQPGMYQIVQQSPGQLQMQQVHQQHQLNNIHHQQLQQTNYQQPQITHQQVQQLNNHHQLNNHTQIQIQQNQQIQQQIQHQSSGHQDNTNSNTNTNNNNNNNSNNNNNNNNQQQATKASASKKKKPKMNKDGVPAPKRATTAYINFTQWYRESIKKTGRTVPKIGEFGKECAAKWNSMTEDEKKPFTEVAARDRDRYRREMEIYKPARDVNKPKRPGTAFMLFMVDFRKEVAGKEPEGGVAALAKLGGERWRGMTDEEKKPYVEQQNECKIRYEKLMEEYRQKSGQLPINAKNEGVKEESLEINSVADSENSEQQNNGDIKQNHSPSSTSASPAQEHHQSPNDQQDVNQQQQLESLASMSMPDFGSNDNFNSGFNQNSQESALYQQTHEQLEQQQIDQQLNQQTHEQQDSSQFTQGYNQHFQWS